MDKILIFLQNLNGDRLFWYGVVFLLTLYIVGKTLIGIFNAIARIFRKKTS